MTQIRGQPRLWILGCAFSCAFGCGFAGAFAAVAEHEGECPRVSQVQNLLGVFQDLSTARLRTAARADRVAALEAELAGLRAPAGKIHRGDPDFGST